MTPSQLIYKSVYDGCIDIGCSESHSRESAKIASDDYSKGRHLKSPSQLIDDAIISAKKIKQRKASKSWK